MEEENKHYVTLFVGCENRDLGKEPEVSDDGIACYGSWLMVIL